MNLLFWLLWTIDLCLGLLVTIGKGFRSSFTASDPAAWFNIVLILVLLGGPILKLGFKHPGLSLGLVSLPLLVLLVWYWLD